MEINGKSPLIDLSTRAMVLDAQEQQAQRFLRADRAPTAADPDRAEFSVRSREIQSINDMIQSTPDVREGVIEKVRRAIEAGTYNVRAEQIAEKILGGNLFDQIF